MTVLVDLPPAQFQAWQLLFRMRALDLAWVLIGGQMVSLLAAENGAALPRPTLDADVLVDVRADKNGLRRLSNWLVSQGLGLEGVNADGVGHRFSAPAIPGPGRVTFDVLAPEGLSARTPVVTVPPARTVSVPGGSSLLRSARRVDVTVLALSGEHAQGQVSCPTVLAALAGKAAATSIVGRVVPERDLQDAALLLAFLQDVRTVSDAVSPSERRHLRRLEVLRSPDHPAWAPLDGEARRRGRAALAVLLRSIG